MTRKTSSQATGKASNSAQAPPAPARGRVTAARVTPASAGSTLTEEELDILDTPREANRFALDQLGPGALALRQFRHHRLPVGEQAVEFYHIAQVLQEDESGHHFVGTLLGSGSSVTGQGLGRNGARPYRGVQMLANRER